MRVAVIQFPGSNNDLDAFSALKGLGADARLVWHAELRNDFDAFVLPGGFSYGDYLRAGIIAAYSPAMRVVKEAAGEGKRVLGICNGFQILTESGLLPGALLRNASTKFVCKWLTLRVESTKPFLTKYAKKGALLKASVTHGEGRYFNDADALRELHENGQVVFKYADCNPNGSVDEIAGVCNAEGNVVGMMPHPERCDAATGSEDTKALLRSLL
jgi:phosphoribosylformylglycinamidine synthase